MNTHLPENLSEFHRICSAVRAAITLTPGKVVDRQGSQMGEDAILEKLLPQARGFYLDIGANDPIDCNNTWKFYQRGWRGILVEPLPYCWKPLLRTRPRDHLVPVAASDAAGEAVLRVCGGLSTLESDWPIEPQDEICVELLRTSQIVDMFPLMRSRISLCSIDVEGHERQVLEGIDFDVFRPAVFCVESLSYTPDNTGVDLYYEWESILLSQGYVLAASTHLNRIYQRSDYAPPASAAFPPTGVPFVSPSQ